MSCLPLFGFAAWFLPAMGGEVAGSSRDPDDAARAQRAQKYLRWAALYGVAYAARGFDPADPGTWAVAAACAAHVQLERLAFEAERRSRRGAGGTSVEDHGTKTHGTNAGQERSRAGRAEGALGARRARGDGRRQGARGGGGGGARAGTEASAGGANGESWRDGDDPLRLSGLGFRLKKGKALSISRPQLPEMPEPPELTVRGVGRAIGATQIAAARLREEIGEGKLRASIEEEEAREREVWRASGWRSARKSPTGTRGSRCGR